MLRCPSCRADVIDLPSWPLCVRRSPVVCPECGGQSRPNRRAAILPFVLGVIALIAFLMLRAYALTLPKPEFSIGAAMLLTNVSVVICGFWMLAVLLNLPLRKA